MGAKNWSVVLALLLVGCDREKLPLIQTTHLEQQAPFRATVVWVDLHDMREFPGEHGPMVIITLQKETGERIAIGGDEQTRAFEGFSRMLRKGRLTNSQPRGWTTKKILRRVTG
jgi:hypothetical protein